MGSEESQRRGQSSFSPLILALGGCEVPGALPGCCGLAGPVPELTKPEQRFTPFNEAGALDRVGEEAGQLLEGSEVPWS